MGAEIIRQYVIDCWLSRRASRPFPYPLCFSHMTLGNGSGSTWRAPALPPPTSLPSFPARTSQCRLSSCPHSRPLSCPPPPPPLSHLLNAGHGVRQHVLEYSVDAALSGEHARSGGVIGIVLHMIGVTSRVTYVEMRTCGVIDAVMLDRCGNLHRGLDILCMGPGEGGATGDATGMYRGSWEGTRREQKKRGGRLPSFGKGRSLGLPAQ